MLFFYFTNSFSPLQSRHGENALLEALTFRRYDMACALALRTDTDVDVLDTRDRTPLTLAVQAGHAHLVRLLLFAGCDPCTEDDLGHNALYYALKGRAASAEMVNDLVEYMSQPQSLMQLCRTVIRRTVRENKVGFGVRLKPAIDRFPKYVLPKRLRKFVAYEQ